MKTKLIQTILILTIVMVSFGIGCSKSSDNNTTMLGFLWLWLTNQESTTTTTVIIVVQINDSDGNAVSNGSMTVSEVSTSIQSQTRAAQSKVTLNENGRSSHSYNYPNRVIQYEHTVNNSEESEIGSFILEIDDPTNPTITDTSGVNPTIGSVTNTSEGEVTYTKIAMSLSDWTYYNPNTFEVGQTGSGIFEETTEELKFYGAGYRKGARIHTNETYDIMDKNVYVKWKANGAGAYMNAVVGILKDIIVDSSFQVVDPMYPHNSMTTHHSFAGSILISENTWYYTRFKIDSSNNVTSVTASGNYDDQGGNTIDTYTSTHSYSDGNLYLCIALADNYGSTSSYKIVGELIIKKD